MNTLLVEDVRMKKTVLPVLLAAAWIGLSEFFRNELLFKSYWTDHYAKLGLVFPSATVNSMMWGVWSLLLAIVIFILAKKYTLLQTVALSWGAGFVMMWTAVGNLGVLPFGLLPIAIPLSLLETGIAALIVKQFLIIPE